MNSIIKRWFFVSTSTNKYYYCIVETLSKRYEGAKDFCFQEATRRVDSAVRLCGGSISNLEELRKLIENDIANKNLNMTDIPSGLKTLLFVGKLEDWPEEDPPLSVKTCECGSHKVYGISCQAHSDWCPMYQTNMR